MQFVLRSRPKHHRSQRQLWWCLPRLCNWAYQQFHISTLISCPVYLNLEFYFTHAPGPNTIAASASTSGQRQIWWCLLRLWGLAVELPVRAHARAQGQSYVPESHTHADGTTNQALRVHVARAFASLLDPNNQVGERLMDLMVVST
jgi:hypothetical protein